MGEIRVICGAQLSSSREQDVENGTVYGAREGGRMGVGRAGLVVWLLRRVVTSKPPWTHRHCRKRAADLLAACCMFGCHVQEASEVFM